MSFDGQTDRSDVVRLEKPSMGNSRLVIYCTPEELRKDAAHLRTEMTKMRTRKPKKARQRPHAKSIAGFKIKQKYSVGAVSPDHGVLKQGELQQLRASKSLGYDKYGPGSAPIPKGRRASRMEKSPVYTPTSAFADMNLAQLQKSGVLAAKRTRHKLAAASDLETNSLDPTVASALILVQNILDKSAYRVIDLFRRSEYNSSIKDKKYGDRDMIQGHSGTLESDNNLDTVEFKHILKSAGGGTFSAAEIKALVRHLDKDGNGQIDVMELTECLRVVKNLSPVEREALKRNLAARRQQPAMQRSGSKMIELSPVKSVGKQRPVSLMTPSGRRDNFTASLLELDRFLHLRRMRALDLFREAEFNTHAVEQSHAEEDIIITPSDFERILAKAGVKLSREAIDNIVYHVDTNHNGEVSVDELESAIKRAKLQRRGGVDAMTRIGYMLKSNNINRDTSADVVRLRARILKERMYAHTAE